MTHYENFTWRGESILDVHAWAAARGERMVKYHAERQVVSPWVPWEMMTEEYDGEMPESFWNGLAMQDGWHYRELA